MSDIVTNRFVTHEGLRDYDTLLKSWLPDISHSTHTDKDGSAKDDVSINAAAAALTFWHRTAANTGSFAYVMRGQREGARIWLYEANADADGDTNETCVAWLNDQTSEPRYCLTLKAVDATGSGSSAGDGPFTIIQLPAKSGQHFRYMATNQAGTSGTAYTLLDTGNINTTGLTGAATGQYPVSKINIKGVAANVSTDEDTYWLLSSPVNDSYQPYRLGDITFKPSTDTLTVPKLTASTSISTTKIDLAEHQYLDKGLYGFNANNSDIINVNSIYMNDPSNDPKEGILWLRSSGGISNVPAQVEFGQTQAQQEYYADILTAYKGGLYFLPNFNYFLPKAKKNNNEYDQETWPTTKYQIVTSESSQQGGTAPETHEVFSASTTNDYNKPRPIWVSGIADKEVRKDGVICPADDLTYNSYTKTLTAENIVGFNAKNGVNVTSATVLTNAYTKINGIAGFPFSLGEITGNNNQLTIYTDPDGNYTVKFNQWSKGYMTKGAGEDPDAAYWLIDKYAVMRFGYISNGTFGQLQTVISTNNVSPEVQADGNKIKIKVGGVTSGAFTVPFAAKATTATKLDSKPALNQFSGNNNKITVTAGGMTSDAFTVPYATKAGSADSATDASYIKIGSKYYSVAFSRGTLILTAKE